MAKAEQYKHQILDIIKDLPEDKLTEVFDFVSFLKERYITETKKKIVKLSGLWKGYEPSDEEIKKSRKEMWEHLDNKEIL